MDHLETLLNAASSSDTPAGKQRVEEITAQLREFDDVDLPELVQTVSTRFEGTYNGGDFGREQEETLYALGDIVEAVAVVRAERDERQEKVASIADHVRRTAIDSAPDDDADEPDPAEGEAPAAPDTTSDVAPAEDDSNPDDGSDSSGDTEVDDAPAASDDSAPGDSAPVEPADGSGDAPIDLDTSNHSDTAEPALAAHAAESRPSTADAVRTHQVSSGSGGAPAPASSTPLRSFSITAAADVPDTPTGKTMGLSDLTAATLARVRDLPVGQPDVGEVKRSVANINRHFDESLVADGYDSDSAAVVDRVADESRLPGGSLVAAAQARIEQNVTAAAPLPTPPGDIWCSPSETDYSLCPPLATRTGLLDLPSFTVRRGGIRYPVWQQYPDQHRPPEHGDPNNDQNNPSAPPRHDWHGYVEHYDPHLKNPSYFVNNPKKCIEGPCVEWAEERMSLSYLCITGDILREHTYPELAERFMSDALLSHEHFLNETWIREIVAKSDRLDPFDANAPGQSGPAGTVPPGPLSPPWPSQAADAAPPAYLDTTNSYWPGSAVDIASMARYGMGSAVEAVIERIGQLVTWFKNAYRTPFAQSWEAIAPYWFREYLKLDIERKSNRPHNLPVSDAEVDAVFAFWGVRVQWVYDWQDMPSGQTGSNGGRVMPRDGWPNNVDIVLYPAGSWALAQQNVLRLSAMYDSAKLQNNKYTALFMEDAWMLLNRCNRSFVVTLRNLCANGAVGTRRDACTISGTTADSVTVTPDTASVEVGATSDLTVTASTADGYSKDVTGSATWTSSDEAIATVDGGTVTGVAAGETTIEASYQGSEATSTVTVTAPAEARSTSRKQPQS